MTTTIRTWGGIGDVILMTPALRALKRQHPRRRLHVQCAGRDHYAVLLHNPYIDRLTVDSPIRRFASFQGRVACTYLRRHGPSLPLPAWLRARVNHALAVPIHERTIPMLTGRSATELVGEMLDVPIDDRRVELWLTDEERRRARTRMQAFTAPIVLHVAGRCSGNKNWPLASWEALVRRNPARTFVQVGAPDDPRVAGTHDLRGAPLRESFALIAAAAGFAGVDSSLAHAASAVGTPGVMLFGPSAAEVWGHANLRAVTRRLRCAPCIDTLYQHPCPYGKACLNGLPVEEVEAALLAELSRAQAPTESYGTSDRGMRLAAMTAIAYSGATVRSPLAHDRW